MDSMEEQDMWRVLGEETSKYISYMEVRFVSHASSLFLRGLPTSFFFLSFRLQIMPKCLVAVLFVFAL